MSLRLAGVERQLAGLQKLRTYFRKKIVWLDGGAIGKPPAFVVPDRVM